MLRSHTSTQPLVQEGELAKPRNWTSNVLVKAIQHGRPFPKPSTGAGEIPLGRLGILG